MLNGSYLGLAVAAPVFNKRENPRFRRLYEIGSTKRGRNEAVNPLVGHALWRHALDEPAEEERGYAALDSPKRKLAELCPLTGRHDCPCSEMVAERG